MELSIVIARIISITYLAFGFGLLFSSQFYKREIPKLVENPALLIYGGFLATVLGSLLIYYHNTWENSWTTVITVIGWIGLIKGITLLIFPGSFKIYKNTIFHQDYLLYILVPLTFIVGLVLGYFGFIA